MEVFIFMLVMKWSSVSCAQRSTYFQILYYAFGKMNENPQSNFAWEDRFT